MNINYSAFAVLTVDHFFRPRLSRYYNYLCNRLSVCIVISLLTNLGGGLILICYLLFFFFYFKFNVLIAKLFCARFGELSFISFPVVLLNLFLFFRYRRVTGLIITHQQAALYTARRQEMIEVLETSFFYLITHPEVHSPLSDLPFQVIIVVAIPPFFKLFYESRVDFE